MSVRHAHIESLEARRMFALTLASVATAYGTQLQITGTSSDDRISLNKTDTGYSITGQGGFFATCKGTYTSIVISAGRGNDAIAVGTGVTTSVKLYGGAGNDTLVG